MKRWHILVIALVACSWIGTGAWWTVRENQRRAEHEAMANRSNWRMATENERREAITVISNQFKAFQRGDFNTALNLQSTQMRSRFRSAQAFGAMMKANYPDYLSHKSAVFGRGRAPSDGSRISIRVNLIANDGSVLYSVYHLMRENKKLLIAGVSGGQRDSSQGRLPQGPAPQPPARRI
jgi:hypothetical protein